MRFYLKVCSVGLIVSFVLVMMVGHVKATAKTTIAWWDPDARESYRNAVQYVIDGFERQNPDVRIEITTIPWDKLPPKAYASYRAGVLPDLLSSTSSWFGSWTFEGIIQPVTDVISKIGEDEFGEGMLKSITIKGDRYVVPYNSCTHVVIYKKDWYEEAGLEKPHTWMDLLVNVMRLHKPGERYGIVLFNAATPGEVTNDLIGCNGSYTFGAEGNVAIDNYRTVEALYMLRALYDHSFRDTWPKAEAAVRLIFLKGVAGHMLTSTSIVDYMYKQGLTAEYAAVPMPLNHGDRGAIQDFNCLSIPSTVKGRELEIVKKFLLHWFEPDVYSEFAKKTVIGHNPSLKSVKMSKEFWALPHIVQTTSFYEAGMEAGKGAVLPGQTFGPNPYAGRVEAENVWGEMGDRVCILRKDPADVAKWAQERIETIIRQIEE
jgi:multiple sugar transport system substrate-binding protein